MGTALAGLYGYADSVILSLALLTTISFQVTSNFANDYGDGVKGTDNEDRIGPSRTFQSGLLSSKELKRGVAIAALVSLLLSVTLIWYAFREESIGYVALFLFLGLASIWASITYTVGSGAYGYKGLGDLFVFLFFGLLSVLGSMFLFTKFLTAASLLPAIGIGLLSTAVLNLNNMRDYVSDRKAGKNTLVVYMGIGPAKTYHFTLLAGAFLSMLAFVWMAHHSVKMFGCLLAFLPVIFHVRKVVRLRDPASLDPELRKIALSTFLLAVLSYLLFNNFL